MHEHSWLCKRSSSLRLLAPGPLYIGGFAQPRRSALRAHAPADPRCAIPLSASKSNSKTAPLLTALFCISAYTRTRFSTGRAVQSGSHHTKQNSSPYASASAAEQSADFDAATALAALALYLSPIALKKTRPTCGEGRQGKRRTSRQAECRECMSSSLVSSRYAAKSWTGLAQSA